jgi:serine protease AprX
VTPRPPRTHRRDRLRPTTTLLGIAALVGPLLTGMTGTVTDTFDVAVDAGVLDDGRALVHVAAGQLDTVAAAIDASGATVRSVYEAIDVVAVLGSTAALERVAGIDGVTWMERDAEVELLTATSHDATRGAELLDGEVTVDGRIVDGAGIGVAVVDSGVDDYHPDLVDRIGENVKVLPGGVAIPLPISDTASLGGHGTHVAGTIVGDGTASDGTYRGAATGATAHSVSAGAFISLAFALDGLEWVLDNHDQVEPAIRVVNNSWGSSGEHNPNSAVSRMVNEIVAAGVTVVFAAGNSGGDGSAVRTSPECTNPTPGVICVAAADDRGEGTRDGGLASFSSRGQDGRPETYPDLSAPGANITATCTLTLPICLTGVGGGGSPVYYSTLSGTSMAAPHVAGIAAQMLQVAPDLTPAQIEQVLTATAYDRGLPAYADGAGHVDAVAAVLTVAGGPSDGDADEPAAPTRGSERSAEVRRNGPRG